jgi:hypothetical protein
MAVGLSLAAASAHAQEKGRLGISMGYPASAGLLWHATERIAIRPSVSFDQSRAEFEARSPVLGNIGAIRTTSITESYTVGLRVDALFSVGTWDNVRAYVAPGYGYEWSDFTSTTSTVVAGLPGLSNNAETLDRDGHGHQVSGTFGARYAPHPRFGVFGEVGLRYFNGHSGLGEASSTLTVVETTAGAGVIFYF